MIAYIKFIKFVIDIKKYEKMHKKQEYNTEEAKISSQDVTMRFINSASKNIASEIIIEGTENLHIDNYVFISNHQGNFDPIFIMYGAKRYIPFIAKKEIESFPIIGKWFKTTGMIFLKRDDLKNAVETIAKGVEQLNNGDNIGIFPEGTRSKNTDLLSFKKGSFKLALKSNKPIIPVTIHNTSNLWENNRFPFKHKRCKVFVSFGQPIYPSLLTKEEKTILQDTVKNIIEKKLIEIKERN